jgi:hypothetical protein
MLPAEIIQTIIRISLQNFHEEIKDSKSRRILLNSSKIQAQDDKKNGVSLDPTFNKILSEEANMDLGLVQSMEGRRCRLNSTSKEIYSQRNKDEGVVRKEKVVKEEKYVQLRLNGGYYRNRQEIWLKWRELKFNNLAEGSIVYNAGKTIENAFATEVEKRKRNETKEKGCERKYAMVLIDVTKVVWEWTTFPERIIKAEEVEGWQSEFRRELLRKVRGASRKKRAGFSRSLMDMWVEANPGRTTKQMQSKRVHIVQVKKEGVWWLVSSKPC